MAATASANQKIAEALRLVRSRAQPATGSLGPSLGPSLAQSLGIDDNELDLLEDFFVAAANAKGASGRKIFARLRNGATLGQALEVPDTAVEILYARAHRWSAVGRHDKAEPIFRALCIVDGQSADFRCGLGICLRARSAWDEALAAFAMASEVRPRWAVPHFHALELCIRRGDWARAATELAAFEQKADSETHPALTAEAERYKQALLLRGGASGVSVP
jgi:tetratricopeptide (TPR) repeat protein